MCGSIYNSVGYLNETKINVNIINLKKVTLWKAYKYLIIFFNELIPLKFNQSSVHAIVSSDKYLSQITFEKYV